MMNRPRALLLTLVLAWLLPGSEALADVPPDCGAYDTLVTCDAASVGQACAGGGTCYKFGCGVGAMMTPSSVYKCFICPTAVDDPAMTCQGPADFGKACGKGGSCERSPQNCDSGGKYVSCLHDNPQPGGAGGGPGAGGGGGAAGTGGAVAGAGGTDSAGAAGSSGGGAGAAGSGVSGGAGTAAGAAGSDVSGGAGTAAGAASDGSAAGTQAASSGCSLSGVGYRGTLAALMTVAGASAVLLDRRRRRR